MILIDTGPLVALFEPIDPDHNNCHKVLTDITDNLYTTEAVLTEVLYMLGQTSKGADGLKDFFLNEYVSLEKIDNVMLKRSFELMDKYADLPMDFADATLVVLAEKHRTNKVFTLDFCDFQTYRFLKGHRYYSFDLLGSDLLK